MIYTSLQLSRLRRMTGLAADDPVYTDAILSEMMDARDGGINATASDIWDEKAAAVASAYDFSADGGDYKQSQLLAQYQAEAAKYRSRAEFDFDMTEGISGDTL